MRDECHASSFCVRPAIGRGCELVGSVRPAADGFMPTCMRERVGERMGERRGRGRVSSSLVLTPVRCRELGSPTRPRPSRRRTCAGREGLWGVSSLRPVAAPRPRVPLFAVLRGYSGGAAAGRGSGARRPILGGVVLVGTHLGFNVWRSRGGSSPKVRATRPCLLDPATLCSRLGRV